VLKDISVHVEVVINHLQRCVIFGQSRITLQFTCPTHKTNMLTTWPLCIVGSVVEKVKVPFLWRPNDRDLHSTPTLIVHVVASLDKMLSNNYRCLTASNKQQIQ